MDLDHLRSVGLFDLPEQLPVFGPGAASENRLASTPDPPDPLDAPAASGSRWSPQGLKEQLDKLPVSQLFPELCDEVMGILHRWHQRLPLKVWSRMVKICKGSAHQVPSVLKELNESAPVIQRVRRWVEALPSTAPKACILDLGAGFGFLSMFLSELLPCEKVKEFCLMDMSYANRGVDNSSGTTSTEHIYKVQWQIPMYTLKVDLKKKTTLNQIAERLLQSEDLRERPIFACGIHLCNTLGIRAAQLFNENAEVSGFAFVPCCFPTSRHVAQQVVYQLGQHRFAAREFLDPKVVPSNTDRIETNSKGIEHHELHRPTNGMFAQNIYIFAERPLNMQPIQVETRGTCVVVDAKFGHGSKAKKKAQKKKR
ncbi:unnamed protein product [Cladocopium goreaui]|uniref:Methyltransferase domain-containing protein n=1 Tax=Cladocopium goreaui TaxID=2562237 RepID=A0A9P1DRG4_9DINO|nr:unnamed protein product [Cladocopium goreaui]